MGTITWPNGVLLAALAAVPLLAKGAETITTRADQQGVALTLYSDNLGLVKEVRRVVLPAGATQLAWREVPGQLRPETVLLRSLTNPAALRLAEQHFDFDLLTPEKLLDSYVGREIWVIRDVGGQEKRERAVVLAAAGPVLKFADRIETGGGGRLAFPALPDRLRDRPTLTFSFTEAGAGQQDLELSYLTTGLSWRADYVAQLNASEDRLDLNGWAMLINQSGTAYQDATVQLVAGDLNRVREDAPIPRVLAMTKAEAPEMQQETLFEYHRYRLPRPTTLRDNQSKQVALMSASGVRVRKEFLLEGGNYYYLSRHGDLGQKNRVAVHMEFDNRGDGLGTPLPGGVMRFYKKDARGSAQFVGEGRIEHTPKNETVRIKLGDTFDVTADRRQTDFQKPAATEREAVFESAYEIVLRNAKPEAVIVTVREPVPGDWRVISESHPHRKASSSVAEWKVNVPAEAQAPLTYRVRVRN